MSIEIVFCNNLLLQCLFILKYVSSNEPVRHTAKRHTLSIKRVSCRLENDNGYANKREIIMADYTSVETVFCNNLFFQFLLSLTTQIVAIYTLNEPAGHIYI